jgi:hydrogenase maturation protease
MKERCEALVLGIGNVLWADEGFGVRAVESLHARYALPDGVHILDGGTQGLYLFGAVAAARRVLVFDAIDFGLAPGTLRVLRNGDVPAWSRGKLSPHQTGFNDILALAQLRGESPEAITLIGVQPEELSDLGGSLRASVKARVPEAVELAANELAAWGFAPRLREHGAPVVPLNSVALDLGAYESGRPSSEEACRVGDARVLARARF